MQSVASFQQSAVFLAKYKSDDDKYSDADIEFPDESEPFGVLFFVGIGVILLGLALLVRTECKYSWLLRFYKRCMHEILEAPASLDPSYEGKLIYITGRLQVGSPVYLTDPELPIVAVSEALVLKRHVEMYQWREQHAKQDSKWVYSYVPEWSSVYIDSKRFKDSQYQNPVWDVKFQNASFQSAPEAYLGPYRISREIKKRIPITEKLRLVVPDYSYGDVNGYSVYVDNTYYYLSKCVAQHYTPVVGDYRIKYDYLAVGTNASIIGAQERDTLVKYNNQLLIVESGIVSAQNLLTRKIDVKKFRQNIFRVLSFIAIVFGLILAT